jgi:hypothetical protein
VYSVRGDGSGSDPEPVYGDETVGRGGGITFSNGNGNGNGNGTGAGGHDARLRSRSRGSRGLHPDDGLKVSSAFPFASRLPSILQVTTQQLIYFSSLLPSPLICSPNGRTRSRCKTPPVRIAVERPIGISNQPGLTPPPSCRPSQKKRWLSFLIPSLYRLPLALRRRARILLFFPPCSHSLSRPLRFASLYSVPPDPSFFPSFFFGHGIHFACHR